MAQIPQCNTYPPPPGYSAVPVFSGTTPIPVLTPNPAYDYNSQSVPTPVPTFNVPGMVSSPVTIPYQQRINYFPSHLTTMAPPPQPLATASMTTSNIFNPNNYSTCFQSNLPPNTGYPAHGQITSATVPNASVSQTSAPNLNFQAYSTQPSLLVYHPSKADVSNLPNAAVSNPLSADSNAAFSYRDPSNSVSSFFHSVGTMYPSSNSELSTDAHADKKTDNSKKFSEPKTSKEFDQYYMNLKSFKYKDKSRASYSVSGDMIRSKKLPENDDFDEDWDTRSSSSVATNYTNPGDHLEPTKRSKSSRFDYKKSKMARRCENYTNETQDWYKPSKTWSSTRASHSHKSRANLNRYDSSYEGSFYSERSDLSCVRVEYDAPNAASYKRRNSSRSQDCEYGQYRHASDHPMSKHNSVDKSRASNISDKKKEFSSKYESFDEEMYPNKRWEKEFLKWLNDSDEEGGERKIWIRSSPSELYYIRDEMNPKVIKATPKLKKLCDKFNDTLACRSANLRSTKPDYKPPVVQLTPHNCSKKRTRESHEYDSDSSSSCSEGESDCALQELERKKNHPDRLHPELWYNDFGEMNDGPVCRCSLKARKSGIRHGFYAGENHLSPCDPYTNNADRLYHYRITISPPTNFLVRIPTVIDHDGHEFIFEGFSLLSHFPLERFPTCSVIRFNIQYTILYLEEQMPENFTIMELDLFSKYIFFELLEMVDLELKAAEDKDGCDRFHILPRFVRLLEDNGKEVLSMNKVLIHLLESNQPLIPEPELNTLATMSQTEWYNYIDKVKGMLVMLPGKKPSCIRVDQIDRENLVNGYKDGKLIFPELIHFGIRPPQLSYAGNPEYQKKWREYVRLRHLLANKPKPTYEDKRKLEAREAELQKMRLKVSLKRDVTVVLNTEGFYRTGIMCDLVQHAMLLPVLICHLRFHLSLSCLEARVGYHFKNRSLLQLALTHPSYRENFGTNPDHARNSLTNCGIRHPEYGDRRVHYQNTRKRGINTLIQIMSRFGKQKETESSISHNERLEFLGDAVVEFLTTIHLFFMFPTIEEGGLATYRAAIVQNQHLAVLAQKLELEKYLLYAHGSDLCHESELRHAMANCFEALMGALFLDGGLKVTDKVFSETLYGYEDDLLDLWTNLPSHPLQEQEPEGDRKWISKIPFLQKLTKFEEATQIYFRHIRLLARAFTDRSVGYNDLTMGSNQRLEFLGDTVLQLIASEYLYKHFPEHHEGHLSLLRSSLVNNCTQSVVCDDLGMTEYAVYRAPKLELKVKDRADLLEAYLGALFIDKGLHYCWKFCEVCFFPRLQQFILKQEWNDPKSKLQQCCLTLRSAEGGEPDIPVYKVLECKGPTNMRVYTVAVYFRSKRLAKALGTSIQAAEMNAAKAALESSQDLFPQLVHQQRIVKKMLGKDLDCDELKYKPSRRKSRGDEDSKLPQSYRKTSRKSKSKSSRKDASNSPQKSSKSDSGSTVN